jgi:hypothetical protein
VGKRLYRLCRVSDFPEIQAGLDACGFLGGLGMMLIFRGVQVAPMVLIQRRFDAASSLLSNGDGSFYRCWRRCSAIALGSSHTFYPRPANRHWLAAFGVVLIGLYQTFAWTITGPYNGRYTLYNTGSWTFKALACWEASFYRSSSFTLRCMAAGGGMAIFNNGIAVGVLHSNHIFRVVSVGGYAKFFHQVLLCTAD